MPYELKWHYPQRILLFRLYGDVTLEDVRLALLELGNWGDQGTAPMYTIAHTLDVTSFPTNLNEIRKIAYLERHPNIVWTVLVSRNKLINFIASVFTQLSGTTFRAFDNIDDALEFIALKEPSLPLIKPE